MPHKHLGAGVQIKIHNRKLDVEVSTLPGRVWIIYKWDLYKAAHWLCSQIHEPAGNAERRECSSVFPGSLRAQHPALGSAHSQLRLRPSQHSLKSLLDVLSQKCCETSKKSPRRSLLHNNRAPEHSSRKYESFLVLFSVWYYLSMSLAPSPYLTTVQDFGVKRSPLLKTTPSLPQSNDFSKKTHRWWYTAFAK